MKHAPSIAVAVSGVLIILAFLFRPSHMVAAPITSEESIGGIGPISYDRSVSVDWYDRVPPQDQTRYLPNYSPHVNQMPASVRIPL